MDFRPLAAVFILMAMACFGTPAYAQAGASLQTTDFVHKALQGNMFEIDSSKLALQKTSSKNVQDFAQMMVTDHTLIGDQFKKTLASADTGFSAEETPNEESQKIIAGLKAAAAPAFDSLYVQAQSKAHDQAVALFTDYVENGDNADLRKFASDTLPTLRKHQEMAHALSQISVSYNQ